MAKLDGFLNQLSTKGGTALYLSPGSPATVELPGGHRAMLGTQDLLSPIIDGLVKEILPEEHKTAYLRGDMVVFHRELGEGWYEIRASRSAGSSSLLAHRLTRAPRPAPPPPAAPNEAALAPPPPEERTRPGLSPWDGLIAKLLDMGGSDLYLSSGEPPLVRHQGTVEPVPGFTAIPPDALTKWLESLAPARH
ncbi:MAG TPA: hypothetical protein VL181_05040, partial [Holophagaceae bacterium]|nr:hypothetical protein [Holophagaceae bacterium]